MQFLAPLFLLGTLAIAVPILFHLVRRQSRLRLPFASLMFLNRISVKEIRKQRLKHLLLLAMRCLGILLLVFAFSRPVFTGAWFDRINPLSNRSVIVLIDNSMSMGRDSVWRRALAAAQERIESLQPGDEGMLVQFGDTGTVLTQWEQSPQPLLSVLPSGVKPSYEGTSYFEGMRLAAEQFKGSRNSLREIHLITDLQAGGMGSPGDWKLPPEIVLEVIDVGREDSNVFIEEVRVDRVIYGPRLPYPMVVRIAAIPPHPARGEVQFFLDNTLIDRQPFQVESESSVEVTFRPFEVAAGLSRGRLVLEPAGALAIDGLFHFVVERRQPSQVLILSSGGSERSRVFIESALTSGTNSPFQVTFAQSLTPGALDPAVTRLLVVTDLARPPSGTQVGRFLEEGGAVILALGNSADPQAYNRDWDGILPAELLERQFTRSQNRPFTSLTEVNWEHPVFSIFRDQQRGSLLASQFYGYWKLKAQAGGNVPARFDEGDPALVEGVRGKGRIIVLASAIDPVWTDLPLRPSFLPFWYRLAHYASALAPEPAAFRVGHVLPVPEFAREQPIGGSSPWNVLDPEGLRVIGLQEETPKFIPLRLPGYYEIRSRGSTDWVAVNPIQAESDLRRTSESELRAAFAQGTLRSAPASIRSPLREREQQQSFWWLLLLGAALIFIFEAVLANRIPSKERRRQPAGT